MSIRWLGPDEQPPEGVEPRRYVNRSTGYVRLRWRVGPRDYVEVFEHRWVAGAHGDASVQVHHRNGVRDDNRPENLEVVTPAAHGAEHRSIDRQCVMDLYAAGLSCVQVAAQVGADASYVFRLLVAAGVSIRPGSTYSTIDIDESLVERLHTAGVRVGRIARLLGVSQIVVQRVVDQLGLTPHRPGRPTDAEIEAAKAAIARELAA